MTPPPPPATVLKWWGGLRALITRRAIIGRKFLTGSPMLEKSKDRHQTKGSLWSSRLGVRRAAMSLPCKTVRVSKMIDDGWII
jgi:hypothetical protein